MLIKQVHQNNLILVTINILKILVLSTNPLFNDVAIVYIKWKAYRIQFWYISKDDAISIMNNSNLVDKKGAFFILFINIQNE